MHLKCQIVAILDDDHQHFSVERSYILDPESWMAQIKSHKEENISERRKARRRR